MTCVSLAVFGLIFLSICAVLAWRRLLVKKTLRTSRTRERHAALASRLDSRFWRELALYGGGFVLLFYIFFGQALAVYFGYGDLT
jgi:hypothetical protein